MSKFVLFLVVLAVAGCGVKSREDRQEPLAAGSDLPAGIAFTQEGRSQTGRVFMQDKAKTVARGLFVSRSGQYVIAASNVNFVPREDNTITYRLATADLQPLGPPDYTLQVGYSMPAMEMGELTLTSKTLPDGRTEITYEGIAHGGEWEVWFKIMKGGQVVDTVSYRVSVPQK